MTENLNYINIEIYISAFNNKTLPATDDNINYELCYVAISNVSIQFLVEEGQSE
jgi:hypothetical protein